MARLTAPNGAAVNVADGDVESLLARGFTKADEGKKAPAKKAAAKKSDES